jgi:hypothetical protein
MYDAQSEKQGPAHTEKHKGHSMIVLYLTCPALAPAEWICRHVPSMGLQYAAMDNGLLYSQTQEPRERAERGGGGGGGAGARTQSAPLAARVMHRGELIDGQVAERRTTARFDVGGWG